MKKQSIITSASIFFILLFATAIKAQNCMDLGVNLGAVQYWSGGENPFKDQMKQSGEFLGFYDFNWDDHVLDSIPRDTNGYPNAGIPYSKNLGGAIGTKNLYVRKMISAGGRLAQTQYVFLYDGNGSITFQGDVTVTNQAAGRIELTCTGANNIYLILTQSDLAPNHARNFRLVSLANESSYETDMWRQAFVDRLAPFSTVRMMDWGETNSNATWDWSEHTTATYNCQNTKSGVAYEHIIDLCNSQHKDLWICVPHMADTNYIQQMATIFKHGLDPNLTIYLEYSNEVWNWIFDQFFWVEDDFTWLNPSFPHNDLYDSTRSIYYNTGKLSKRTFELWYDVFAADSGRVKRVVACQGGNVYVAQEMIDAIGNDYDYLSPDWYFGASEQTNFTGLIGAQDVIDSCRSDFYQNRWAPNLAHYTLAQQAGKKVICYEGGQHITANGNSNYAGLQAFYDAQVHPNMYTLYDDVLDTLRYRGAELLMAYTLAGENGPYGSWGQISNVNLTPTMANAPKYMALLDNLPHTISGCGATSIEDAQSLGNFLIYPNPANQVIQIQSEEAFEQFQITALSGATVLEGALKSNFQIEISSLKAGLYFITLKKEGIRSTRKFCKQ
ncbi:MAG TPA: T9SS type A sorting domain-containing protein [Bacteroidetes bacterium]|nr:T9SS type A sorting domain-containing protein [Bacteroidota bacterium]